MSNTYTDRIFVHEFVRFMEDLDNIVPPSPLSSQKEALPSEQTSNILVLTDKTFKNAISTNTPVLVMFHAPWCGHCEKMKPEYFKAADEMEKEGLNSQLAIFDCIENPEITEEYEISGFPTIKLFVNGKHVSDYKGTRTWEDFKKFMQDFNSLKKDEL